MQKTEQAQEQQKTVDIKELTKQLEFYLSDANLARDQFFHSKASETDAHFIHFEFFLKCNKVKKLGAANEDLVKAVEASEKLELNEEKDRIRRAGNPELPAFKAQKRLRVSGNKLGVPVNNETDDTEKKVIPSDVLDPLILFIREVNGIPKNGKLIEEEIGKKFEIKVPFARIGTSADGGHLLLDKQATKQEIVDELLNDGFKLGEKLIKFDRGTDRDRDHFLKEHARHVNNIIKRKFGKKLGRPDKDLKRYWEGPVKFLDVKYPSLEAFRSRFKGLITKTPNGGEINAEGVALLKELLKYHQKSEEKLKDVKGFTVDFHPNFNQTRCFFIVREDGTKEDFSYHKCVHNLVNQLGKKK